MDHIIGVPTIGLPAVISPTRITISSTSAVRAMIKETISMIITYAYTSPHTLIQMYKQVHSLLEPCTYVLLHPAGSVYMSKVQPINDRAVCVSE